MRTPACMLIAIVACALICAGCGDEALFRANPSTTIDPDEAAIQAKIRDLADGAHPEDAAASVRYDTAVNDLILRGTKVETRVIDALRGNADPWVRIGCVEVLTAIGTKAAMPHLIAVLDDPEPLVAQRANIALQTLTGQRMIPEAGKPAIDGIPPVPPRSADDLALNAEERIWMHWYAEHKEALKAGWERWWAANKATAKLQ